MRHLTKETERVLINAIEKAAELVNTGLSPNEAIIKSASEHEIPSGHISLMVHAYNTGRTTKQREQGESALEKAAEFTLADAEVVRKALYPETVKTSAELVRETVISTDYAVSAAGMLARRRAGLQKAAAAQVALPEKTWTPPPRDERAEVMRQQSQKMAAARLAEEQRREASVAYAKAAAAMEDLNVYFRTPGNMPFGDAVREVGLRLGEPGASVLYKVAAVYPHFTKQADTQKHYFGDDQVYGLVQNVLDSVTTYTRLQSEVPLKKAAAVSEKTAPQFLTGSILVEEKPLTLKAAAGFSDADNNLPANQKIDELSARLDRVNSPAYTASPTPATDAVVEDIEFNSLLDRNRAEAKTRNADRLRQDMLDQARQFEANEQRGQQEQQESQFDAMMDNSMRKKWREGVAENEKQIAAKADAEAADAKQKEDDKRKKEYDTAKATGKSIGEAAGKELNKVKFTDVAFSPMKFIAEGMGAKGGLSEMAGLAKKDPGKIVREQFKSLVDPSHETALRTIRAKGVLHDMILNDPVISGYDPQDVAMAFNEISELAPSLSDTPALIRPLLRKRLEAGQLADFDVKQILDMDKLRADRDKSITDARNTAINMVS